MSTPNTLSARIAEETKIAEAVTNTERRLDSLRTTLPELESKFEHKREAFNADTAAGRKAVYPAESQAAVKSCEDEITSLDGSLTKLRADLNAARKATKATEAKERQAAEYADLIALCDALEPALIHNDKLKLAHDTAGAMHRSLALPWFDRTMLDGLRAYAKAQITPAAPKPLPSTHVRVRFLKSWPGSLHSSSIGVTAPYSVGEICGLPRRTAAALEAAGVICHAPLN